MKPLAPPTGAQLAVVSVDGRELGIVADAEEHALALVDLTQRAVVGRVPLEGAPGQVLVDGGGTIFAALRGAGEVVALRLRSDLSSREVARHVTGDEPYGLAVSADGKTLHVTSIVDAHLESYRAADLSPVSSAAIGKDPRSVVALEDGRVVVSHATGGALSVVTPGSEARAIPLGATERRRDFGQVHVTKPMMPAGDFGFDGPQKKFVAPVVQITMKRNATQGFALAAIGKEVFAPETLVLTSDGSEITTGYGSVEQSTLSTHVPFVARVKLNEGQEQLVNAVFSGPEDRSCFEGTPSCILPRAAASDGKNVYIACLDVDAVLVVDPNADYEHAPACKKARSEQRRMAVDAPTGLVAARLSIGEAVVVYSEHTRRVSVTMPGVERPIAAVEIPREKTTPFPVQVARGRALFHKSGDKKISGNGRACASCHVDGRDDGLVWPTPKGKRQTPMLAGRLVGTEPYDWNGAHATLAVHIQSTVKNLGGTGMPSEDIDALAAYVKTIEPPHKRPREDFATRRGEAIFRSEKAACSSCHEEGTRFTDGTSHALGPGQRERFDTPSLAFVGQTAPYFHDGRFATLDELVDKCDGVMGTTKHLTKDDKSALVAYLRTL